MAAPVATGGVDYSKPDTWLCRPGRNDVCALPMSVTTITADGKRSVSPPIVANPNAPIDCFYVYPTVSNDPGGNSDMKAGPEEIGVTFAQFSPLRTQCRLFAPLYRQITLAALRSRFTPTPMAMDAAMARGIHAAAPLVPRMSWVHTKLAACRIAVSAALRSSLTTAVHSASISTKTS